MADASHPATGLDHRCLGSFEVRRDGEVLALGGPRQRAVLAVLTLSRNDLVSTDALIDQVWAGDPPASATATLQGYVASLRRALEPHRAPRTPPAVLVSRANGYSLVVPPGACDLDRFVAAMTEARDLLEAGDAQKAVAAARRALGQWRGPALADFADEPFAAPEVLRLEEARLQCVELRMDAALAAGHHADVVGELQVIVAAEPLRERLRGQLMVALYRSGRQADALEVARHGRRILAEELGLDPDPALQQLELSILRQDPALDAPDTSAPVSASGAASGLIGRADECGVLERGLAAAAAGTGRVVLIGGEAGIGKTRLAEAFASEVTGALVLWGRCHETEGAPSFWPWREVLRELGASLDETVLRQATGVDAGVVAEVVPELAGALGVELGRRPPDAETARFHFFDAVTRLLVRAAESRPLVVVLEDLHWADEPSVALLRFVVRRVRGSGLLLVGTHRSVAAADPSVLGGALAAMAREPVVERLLLPGLDQAETAALVSDVLGRPLDDGLGAEVLARTGGNPLFIVHLAELLRMASGGPDDLRAIVREQMPPGMVELIGLRFAEQPDLTRRLLEIAAVVGRSFGVDVLVAVSGASFDEVLDAVASAVAAGLVVEAGAPGDHEFTHALMREAIVARLGRSRAARLHGLVGDALAAAGIDDESLPALAHHYWEASKMGWAGPALEAATGAARAAITRVAYEDAERHLERAASLVRMLPTGDERDRSELALRMQVASHLMRSRGYAVHEVGEACAQARELAARLQAPTELLVASWGLAAHHLVRGEHGAAVRIGEGLLAAHPGGTLTAIAGHLTVGIPQLYLGQPLDAVTHLEQALALAEAASPQELARFPQDLALGAAAFLAWAQWGAGDGPASETTRQRALAPAEAVGGYDEVFARMVSAQLGVLRRDADQVLDDTERMLARSRGTDFQHLVAHARVMRGWALAQHGEVEPGLALLQEGLAYFDRHESSTRLVHNLTLLAEVHEAAGRADLARAAIARAVAACATSEERFYEPPMRSAQARLGVRPPGG